MKNHIYKITVKSNREFRYNSINELLRSFDHFQNTLSFKIIGNNWIRKKFLHPSTLLIPDLSRISPFYDECGFQETERVMNLHMHGYMIVPYVSFRQSMDVLKALPPSEKTHRVPDYPAFRVWTERYRFDERDYDGYISKSFERLSGFGNRAVFGQIRTPRRRESFLMNDMAGSLLEKLCEVTGVDLQPEERALV